MFSSEVYQPSFSSKSTFCDSKFRSQHLQPSAKVFESMRQFSIPAKVKLYFCQNLPITGCEIDNWKIQSRCTMDLRPLLDPSLGWSPCSTKTNIFVEVILCVAIFVILTFFIIQRIPNLSSVGSDSCSLSRLSQCSWFHHPAPCFPRSKKWAMLLVLSF